MKYLFQEKFPAKKQNKTKHSKLLKQQWLYTQQSVAWEIMKYFNQVIKIGNKIVRFALFTLFLLSKMSFFFFFALVS